MPAPALELERRSSALTMSDMEIFVFPELIYSLLLANLMSPRIWRWREDPWFAGIAKMKPYRRVLRLKQYIMDHYIFNLDLDTWGLTTKTRELARFRDFIDADILRQSNALFGYEGDKYYFDLDIRTHFGLDKYDGEIIPYWKTETVEAMDAFRHKAGYQTGAGECVSLAVLYAAALFIVARIPLADIFMMATPLHSQNFIDLEDGVLTNNRRLVTQAMWFNGTALSAQARRALENERVTVVAHATGHIHVLYPEATLDRQAYARFSLKLRQFLKTELTSEMLGNFIRHSRELQKCFQVRWPVHGVDHYIRVDRVFAYEPDSSARLTDQTRSKLMAEIDVEEFQPERMPDGIVLNDLEAYLQAHPIDWNRPEDIENLKRQFACGCLNAALAIDRLIRFCHVQPRLPDPAAKTFVPAPVALALTTDMDRDAVMARLESIRARHRVADLAFYAYRDINRVAPEPFLRAALERNPVSITGARDLEIEHLLETLGGWPAESIYDAAGRLAQPDEVWNYQRGDGLEKAVLLANILRARRPLDRMALEINPDSVRLIAEEQAYAWPSAKQVRPQTWPLNP